MILHSHEPKLLGTDVVAGVEHRQTPRPSTDEFLDNRFHVVVPSPISPELPTAQQLLEGTAVGMMTVYVSQGITVFLYSYM